MCGTVARFSRLWYLKRKYYPVFADSPARKTRCTHDLPINQSRRALKRYNVILAADAREEDTGGRPGDARARGKGRRAAESHSAAFIARALTSSLEATQTPQTLVGPWRDDWQTLAPGATRRRPSSACAHRGRCVRQRRIGYKANDYSGKYKQRLFLKRNAARESASCLTMIICDLRFPVVKIGDKHFFVPYLID